MTDLNKETDFDDVISEKKTDDIISEEKQKAGVIFTEIAANEIDLIKNKSDYISELEHHDHMEHWFEDARYARLIRELVRSDGY